MNIKDFLTHASDPLFWQKHRAFCFAGTDYSFRFFTQLFSLLQQRESLGAPYQRIDPIGREKRELHGLLSQSVLGDNSFFWLGNLSEERESKNATAFKEYVCAYAGPNTIAFFIETDQLPAKTNALLVSLPSMLDYHEFLILAAFFCSLDLQKKLPLVEHLFHNRKQSLTRCLELFDYVSLANSRNPDAFANYLELLYEDETNLQQLADYFFAKQEQLFFSTWQTLQQRYPPVFWVIFWSEQLWKAVHVTHFMRQKQFVLAKKMSYRLPYNFINKSWQSANTKELIASHEFMYQIDYAIKTGSSFCSQDLFFAHYFAGFFAKESHHDLV